MSTAKKTAPSSGKTSGKAGREPAAKSSSKLSWILGWIVVPGLLVSMLYLGGVHVGARHPQMALSRAVLWVMSAEPQLGPDTAAERQPLAHRLRLMALPSTTHSLQSQLTAAELAELVAAGAGPSAAELDCARVCEIKWTAKHADRAFLNAERCVLTPATPSAPAEIECDARVQRAAP